MNYLRDRNTFVFLFKFLDCRKKGNEIMYATMKNIMIALNKHKKMVLCSGGILLCLVLYILTPRVLMPKPIISNITPSEVMQNCYFNTDKSIVLTGENFGNITGVYVNGVWESGCNIISAADDSLIIRLPESYYNTEGNFSIQVQTKINSDLFAKSNKKVFTVLSDDDIEIPEIKMISPEILSFDGSLFQNLILQGENLTENSIVTINDRKMDTSYDGTFLTVSIPYSEWYLERKLRIHVVQYFAGYPTSIKSIPFYLETKSIYETSNEDEESIVKINHDFMLEYLDALRNEDYIVIFAVKDESSQAMTDEIVAKMNQLGLEKNLYTAGVHRSYIAVLDGYNLIYEDIGTDALTYDNKELEVALHVESANFDAGNYSVIQIDGQDYSVNDCGLNIVVYDKKKGSVIDSVCFNTYSGLYLTKN